MKKKQKKALYGEMSSLFTDLAKYIATGVIVTTLLKDFGENTIIIYALGIIAIGGFFGLGLLFTKYKEE